MGVFDSAGDRLAVWSLVLLAAGSVLVASLIGIAGWLVLAVVGAATGAVGSLLPLFVAAVLLSLPLTVAATVLVAIGFASRAASVARTGRTERAASYLERESDLARALGVADLVESYDSRSPAQRADDRIQRAKERYVDGVISEEAFERRVREILVEEGVPREHRSYIDDELREGRRELDR